MWMPAHTQNINIGYTHTHRHTQVCTHHCTVYVYTHYANYILYQVPIADTKQPGTYSYNWCNISKVSCWGDIINTKEIQSWNHLYNGLMPFHLAMVLDTLHACTRMYCTHTHRDTQSKASKTKAKPSVATYVVPLPGEVPKYLCTTQALGVCTDKHSWAGLVIHTMPQKWRCEHSKTFSKAIIPCVKHRQLHSPVNHGCYSWVGCICINQLSPFIQWVMCMFPCTRHTHACTQMTCARYTYSYTKHTHTHPYIHHICTIHMHYVHTHAHKPHTCMTHIFTYTYTYAQHTKATYTQHKSMQTTYKTYSYHILTWLQTTKTLASSSVGDNGLTTPSVNEKLSINITIWFTNPQTGENKTCMYNQVMVSDFPYTVLYSYSWFVA